MADKKITVLGDSANEALTPEEEHRIEVKVDEMLAPGSPEKQQPAAEEPKIQKRSSKILVLDSPEEKVAAIPEVPVVTHVAPEVKSAPPLPKKVGKKVSIKVRDHSAEPETLAKQPAKAPAKIAPIVEATPKIEPEGEELSAELAPAELPKSSLDINIENTNLETVADEEEPAATNVIDLDTPKAEAETAEPSPETPEVSETTDKSTAEPEPLAEEPAVKKYRPPDGPMPFKRAEPLPELEPENQDMNESLPDDDIEPAKTSPMKTLAKHRPHPRKAWLVLIVLIIIGVVAGIPKVRVQALNLVHVRGSLTVTVVDSKKHLPLQNVNVQDGTVTARTDQAGKATLTGLKLGSQTVTLQKAAFATTSQKTMMTWKTASLGSVTLQQTGTLYGFAVTDYVSGKPLAGAQATADNDKAQANAKGQVSVAVSASDKSVRVSASGYQPVQVPLPSDTNTAQPVTLIPSTNDVYITKQASLFDVYKATVDGQNKKLLLAGTGHETSDMSLVANSDGNQAALVSTRDNQRDKAGYLLDTLTLINVQSGATSTLGHGQQIKIVGWFGNRLVYTVLQADVAANDASRYELFAYNTTTKKQVELDHANSFNDVATASGAIYYAAANTQSGGTSGLYKINPDGSGKQTLLASTITDIVRTDYDDFAFSGATANYTYKLGGAKPAAANAPSSGSSRLYVDSPDGKHSAWVDTDTGTLTLYTKAKNSETTLTQQTGLTYPIRWLNSSTLIYRVSSSTGVADYAISILGGNAKEVTSVIDMAGLALWQD